MRRREFISLLGGAAAGRWARARSSPQCRLLGFSGPRALRMLDISLLQFVRVCVNQAIRVTKLQSSRVGRMADRRDCRNLRLSWLPFT